MLVTSNQLKIDSTFFSYLSVGFHGISYEFSQILFAGAQPHTITFDFSKIHQLIYKTQ